MAEEAVRQRYRLATGGGEASNPPKTPGKPGFKRGGSVGKQAGGSVYSKGGKAGGKR